MLSITAIDESVSIATTHRPNSSLCSGGVTVSKTEGTSGHEGMLLVPFDIHRVVHHECIPQGRSVLLIILDICSLG